MKRLTAIVMSIMLMFSLSCDKLDGDGDGGLSEEEIVQGLKTALQVGTDTAVSALSLTDGYYKGKVGQAILKIFLPPEADVVVDNISAVNDYTSALGYDLNEKLEDLYLAVNRSAEDAASLAKPIFVDAITGMSISDGMDILKGDSTEATNFLKTNTQTQLTTAFSPKIDESLDKPLITLKDGSGSVSANYLWDQFKNYYAQAVDASEVAAAVPFAGIEALEPMEDVSLGEYVTGMALNGLFLRVGQEEANIRSDPYQYVVDILEKVFGSLFDKKK